MRYSDLHTHSTFSDGVNSVEEMVRRAVEQNLLSIGLSDHSTTPFDLRYCMREGNLSAYLEEVERVKKKYEGQIQVYTGLEWDGWSVLEDRERFDYLIGDCHYIQAGGSFHSVDHAPEEHFGAMKDYFAGDALAYARAYYDTYVQRTQLNRPHILGHFDLVRKFDSVHEEDPKYRSLATEALLACLEVTPIVEVNMNPLTRGYRLTPYPDRFLLEEILAHGGAVTVCSDAHRTGQIAGCFDIGLAYLKGLGFKSVVMLHNGAFEEFGI